MTIPLGGAQQTIYATNISAQLGQYTLWDPSWAMAAASDGEIYEKMLRDPVIAGALDHLQTLIVGHDYSFEPESDTPAARKMAKVLEGLTKCQRGFSTSLYNLARATFMGAAWGLIAPTRRVLTIGDGKPREWTIISRVRDVDKRRFRLTKSESLYSAAIAASGRQDYIGTSATGLKLSDSSLASALTQDPADVRGYDAGILGEFRWEFHRGWAGTRNLAGYWGPLENVAPYDRWIQHVPDTSERGMGYGYGLADDIYFYFWCKSTVLRYGLQGLERWGQGFLYAKTKALRDQMAKGSSQNAALQGVVDVLRTARSENIVAVDDLTEVQLLDMPSTAEASVREWIDYFDREIVKRILAALQPTGGQAGHGSFSSAKVEEGSNEARVAYLRGPLEETWTNTAARFLVEHNEENLRELGLAGEGVQRLRLKGREVWDVDKVDKIFRLARELNMPVRESDFYSMTGLSAPNEDDDVIQWPQAAPLGADPGEDDPLAGMDGIESPGAKPIAMPGARKPVGEGHSSVAEEAA